MFSFGCARPTPPAPTHYTKIDTHTHFGPDAAAKTIAIMDKYGIDAVVNLSGGPPGEGLEEQLAAAKRFPGRIFVFCMLDFRPARRGPGWGAQLERQVRRARELGAVGLKVPKGLGIAYRDAAGKLIAVDDPELDRVFEAAGELGMPVAIHTGDPVAFWKPVTRDNERWDELSVHPAWSYYGSDVPSWEELYAQLERRVARHPKTVFISVHFGNAAEYPERVAALMQKYPNLWIDTAARVPEMGRYDPGKMRAIFERFQDRILFGTDLGVGDDPEDLMLGSTGATPPTQADVDRFFGATWRYFETADRGFSHPTPIQGNWTIDGIALPAEVLRKVYGANAARLLRLPQAQSPAP